MANEAIEVLVGRVAGSASRRRAGRARPRWGGSVSYACPAPGTGHCNGYCAERLKMAEGVIEYAAPWISDSARSCAAGPRNWRRWRSTCRRADFRRTISQRCLPTRAANRG